jgi:hypothetical protein
MESRALDPNAQLYMDIAYPDALISPRTRALLEGLMQADPNKRLGSEAMGGIEALKAHPYFSDIDWERLARQELSPPFQPDPREVHAHSIGEVGGEEDFFLEEEARRESTVQRKSTTSPHSDSPLSSHSAEEDPFWADFTYVNPSLVQAELIQALEKWDHPSHAQIKRDKEREERAGCCVIL